MSILSVSAEFVCYKVKVRVVDMFIFLTYVKYFIVSVCTCYAFSLYQTLLSSSCSSSSSSRRPLACCDRGFESHRGHGCLSVVSVVCCQRSLRRTDHSPRGVLPTVARRCVCSRKRGREEAIAPQERCKLQTHNGL
jgi:hypothetical protein